MEGSCSEGRTPVLVFMKWLEDLFTSSNSLISLIMPNIQKYLLPLPASFDPHKIVASPLITLSATKVISFFQ